MNITDVDKLDADGVETTAGDKVLLEDGYLLARTIRTQTMEPGAIVEIADGPALRIDKRVARNAQAAIFRCTLIEEAPKDNGRPTD